MLASTYRTLTPTQRIDRCVGLLASSPKALDILLASLKKARDDPTVERFRKVPVDHPTFRLLVGSVPGARELLFACGYEPMHGHLVLQTFNRDLLERAVVGMEAAQKGDEYRGAKALLEDEQRRAKEVASKEEESRKTREKFAKLVKPEPSLEDNSTSCTVVAVLVDGERVGNRRFDSEHTLRDLLNYIRSLEGAPQGSFQLENVTTAPYSKLDIDRCLDCSLYSLDLWPRSHVRVVRAAA